MTVNRLRDVLAALQAAVEAVLLTASVPIGGTIVTRWPEAEDVVKAMTVGRFIVSIFPTGRVRDVSRFASSTYSVSPTIAETNVGRVNRDIQISVWSPSEQVRETVAEAIVTSIGTQIARSFPLPNGDAVTVQHTTDSWDDAPEANAARYVAHIIFAVEYDLVTTTTSTPIATAEADLTVGLTVGGITELLHSP